MLQALFLALFAATAIADDVSASTVIEQVANVASETASWRIEGS